jgi:hypothetical protein
VHAATGHLPAERLVVERDHLQPMPRPYRGRPVRPPKSTVPTAKSPSRGYQHPLSAYDNLIPSPMCYPSASLRHLEATQEWRVLRSS